MSSFAARAMPVMRFAPAAIALSFLLTLGGFGPLALAPLVMLLVVVFTIVTPLRYSAAALLAVALIIDNPGERPADGRWKSPLYPLGEALYLNLHKLTHIALLRFSGLELALGAIAVLLLYRKWTADDIDDPLRYGALPNPMRTAAAGMLAALMLMFVYGILRGGDFKNALWQIRQLAWMPVIAVIYGNAIKTERGRRWLLRIVIGAAVARALLGIYTKYAIVNPAGWEVEYVTTHSDAILAVMAMLMTFTLLMAKPCIEHILLNLLAQPVLLLGLIVNDRRIAFVSLGAGLFTIALLSPPEIKRIIRKLVILSIPFAIVYTIAGWNSHSGVFKPVQIVRSVTEQEDASSETRDIENYNLIQTLKRHPILGSGFGHEYVEVVQAFKVDHLFAQYKFVAHNSVLWFIAIAGPFGFAVVWSFFGMAVSVALKVLRLATGSTDRAVAMGTIGAVLAVIVQAWGDMGLQSWMGTMLLGAFVGATGSLAVVLEAERAPDSAAGTPESSVSDAIAPGAIPAPWPGRLLPA